MVTKITITEDDRNKLEISPSMKQVQSPEGRGKIGR